MSESPVVATPIMHRHLREQPVLRTRGMWDPSNPDHGGGPALGEVQKELESQQLTRAGSVYICMDEPMSDGLVPGEAVIPVSEAGRSAGAVEAVTLPAVEAVSVLYRDDIHLTSGDVVVQRLREYFEREGITPDGPPRWVYYTSPDWNLEPADHLIEVLWPIRS